MGLATKPAGPAVFQSSLSAQRRSRLVQHQFAATPKGGRRALACRQSLSLGQHGGFRNVRSGGQRSPCRFCGQPHASPSHESSCSSVVRGPAVTLTGHPVEHHPVKACGCPAPLLACTMRLHSIGAAVWQPSSCRRAHQGTMQAWGWCTRYAKPYQSWDSLAAPVGKLLQQLKSVPPDVAHFIRRHASDIHLSRKDFAGRPGGACAFLGKCYVPSMPTRGHGPPVAVAQALRGRVAVPSCHATCRTCATSGCLSCPLCPMHVDRVNQSWTLLILYQSRRAPRAHQAWFAAGDTAFGIRGGLVACSVLSLCARAVGHAAVHAVSAVSTAGTRRGT